MNANSFQTKYEKYTHSGLSLQQVLEIKSAYDLFDVHGSGRVSPKELQTCLLNLGFEARSGTLYTMLAELEQFIKESRPVMFDDFLKLVTASSPGFEKQPMTYNEVRRIFHLFDVEGVGVITAEKLKEVCDDLGEHLSPEEINEMIRRADRDGDGCVNLDDFYNLMTQHPLL